MKRSLNPLAAALALALLPTAQAATFSWTAGSFVAGTTAPDPLAVGDVLEITGSGAKNFGAGVAWTNDGIVRFAPGVNVSIGGSASVTNNGLWDLQSDFGLVHSGGGSTPFVNTGTLRKSAGTGTSSFSGSGLALDHRGTLEAQTGTLNINTPLAVFRDGARYRGAGRVEVTNSARFEGVQDTDNLALAGGTNRVWTGADAVVQGRLSWETGSLAGGWQVAAGSQLVMAGAGSRGVNGGTLVNDGTVAWATAGTVSLGSAAVVHNRALWDAQADGSITINGGAQFVNDGTLRKSAGTGTTSFAGSSSWRNTGTIDVQTGTLQIASTSNRFEAGSVYQGAGRMFVSSSSTFAGLQQTQNLVLGGGTNRVWTGEGALVQGRLGWESGSFAGTWTLGAGQALRTSGSGTTGFTGSATVFTNLGTIEWAGSSDVRLGSGATLVNEGLIALQANVDINTPGGGGRFVNRGRLEKQADGAASIASVGLTIDNRGVIDVQRGELRLPNSHIDRGTLTGDGSFVVFNGMASEGTIAPGSHGVGTLTINGDDGIALGTSSTLAIDLQSTAAYDRLFVGQALSLQGGTLALNCWLDCSFAVGDVLTIASFIGEAGGSFANVTLGGFGTGAFALQYDTGAIRLLVTEAVTPVPEPGTWALLAAGLLAVGSLARRRALGRAA